MKKTSSARRKAWTPEELESYYQRQGKAVPAETRQVLESLGLASRIRTDLVPAPLPGDEQALVKKKRRGVSVSPIIRSLHSPFIYARAEPGPTLSLWFDGARLLTVNELFSIFQYRKHETYAYKKAWRKLIERSIQALPKGQAVPFFDGPTRIWLYRRGKQLVDLESLPVMFKYAVDALRIQGVIPDDNPEIIVEPRLLQEKGLPTVAMRLERLPDWQPANLEGLRERWVGPVSDPS